MNLAQMLTAAAANKKQITEQPSRTRRENGRDQRAEFLHRMESVLRGKKLTTHQVAELAGYCDRNSANNALWRLAQDGLVKRVGKVAGPGGGTCVWTWVK